MFGRRVKLFSIFGFDIRLDASWIVIAALVTWSLAAAIFPVAFPGLPAGHYWAMGACGAVLFFASIVFHELCHSLVANHYKLPMKGITLFIFGGVAEMGGEPQSPKIEFLMAIAGPLASIAIGCFFRLLQLSGTSWPVEVVGVLAYLAWINWALALFNLIPAFPLDGGRVLRAALWHFTRNLLRATKIASAIGAGFGILLMAFAVWQLLTGYFISAIWYFLIGGFLRGASLASFQQLKLRLALEGEEVRRFMHPNPVAVPADLSLRELVEDYFYRYDQKVYPVVEQSQDLVGCVTANDVKAVPRDEWDRHHVSELVHQCPDRATVTPDTSALRALAKIQETGGAPLLVTEQNHLLATVSPRDISNFLQAKMEMEGNEGERHPQDLAA
jgi:Zn-dependent protease/CBS domain-containing protein